MILKLFKLNKSKLEQNIMLKQQLLVRIKNIDDEILNIQESMLKVSVQKHGAIGDFKLLAIHKNTMKHEKEKLSFKKYKLKNEVEMYDKIIISFQKEIEKYSYILQKEKKEKLKKLMKYDDMVALEYSQSKYISSKE